MKAYVAIKKGRREWEPVSAEISLGGGPTTAQRPPTVQEAAGPDAVGKMLAIANARFEQSRIGRKALVVEYVLQQKYEPGKQYFVVIDGASTSMEARITTSLIRAKVGEKDEISVSSIGPRGFPTGNLSVYIGIQVGLGQKQVVSNTISVMP